MPRNATLDDIPKMLGMAERFVEVAWGRIGVPMDPDTCANLLCRLIDADDGILIVNDDCTAMIGALVHPWHFNIGCLTATELFWWADPGAVNARALWDEAEAQAQALGAQSFNMACQDHMRAAALGRIYESRGYSPSEHTYIKAFG